MKTNNCFEKKFSIVLVAILCACFVAVFVATLFASTAATTVSNLANVAEAYIDESSNMSDENGGTAGTAGAIFADGGHEFNATHFGFPGTDSTKTTWSVSDVLTATAPTKDNFQAYRSGGAQAPLYTDGGVNNWKYGSTEITHDRQHYSAINIILGGQGSFIDKIAANTMYKLKVTVSAKVTVFAQRNTAAIRNSSTGKFGLISSEGGYDAKSIGGISPTWSSTVVAEASAANGNEVTKDNTFSVTADVTGRILTIATSLDWSYGGTALANSCKCWLSLSNMTISLTITKEKDYTYGASTVKEDGGNPVVSSVYNGLANSYVKNVSGSGYAPYITTDKVATDAIVYDTDLTSILNRKLDNVANGSGTLQSYTNKPFQNQINGKYYYKYAQIEYVDTYNYYYDGNTLQQLMNENLTESKKYSGAGNKYVNSVSGDTITWANNDVDFCSGIKLVTINGETEIEVYSETLGAEFKDSDGVVVGYVDVKKTDASRVVVQLYFYKNANISINVEDYGSGTTTNTLSVSGIDTDQPIGAPIFSTEDSVIYNDYNLVNWARTSKLTVDVDEDYVDLDSDSSTTFTPYVWFYTVRKNNSSPTGIEANPTYNSYADIKAAGLRPIAVSEGTGFSEFVYNFVDGTAQGISLGSRIADPTSPACTGSGYYRFKFYVCDLAGNLSEYTKEFYVKVDYETPYATTTLKDTNGKSYTSANNGEWSTLGENLQVRLLKKNISGNTLQFETGDGLYTLVLDETGKIVSLNGEAVDSFQKVVNIMGTLKTAQVTITTESDGAALNIKFSIPKMTMFAWDVSFIMYAGQTIEEYQNPSANIEEVSFDGESFQSGVDKVQGINFTSEIKVYIDDTKPVIPVIADADAIGYFVEILNDSEFNVSNPSDIIKTNRTWFTKSNLKMGTVVSFEDDIVDSDFAADLGVYYGVKAINTRADFDGLQDFLSKYNDPASLSFKDNAYKSYFTRVDVIKGNTLDGSDTDWEADFVQSAGANLRVVFIWAVDQAGNRSNQVKMYYVLADPTKYTVRSSTHKNDIASSSSSIQLTNEDGNAVTEFVRGETITMTFSLENGFVPYLLNQVGTTTTSILTNITPNIAWKVAEEYDEDHTNLIRLASTDENEIVMSFVYDNPTLLSELEKSVTLDFSYRKVVGYTLTNTSVRYTGYAVEMPMTFSDEKSIDAFKYDYKDKNGIDLVATPVIPGNYKVKIYIPDDDENFVADNHDTVNFVDFEITNGIATVYATHSISYYSETSINDLSYTIPEIDYAFIESIKGDPSQFKGSLKLNVAVATSEYNGIEVGSYAIVQDTPFWIQYYDITFVGEYHDVLQKVITVDILDGDKVFGTTDSKYKFTVNYEQFGNINEANSVFGFEYTTYSGGSILTYETSTFVSREAGEDAGVYDFINNPQAFAITNKNYAIRIDSLGKYTINKREIEINASGQEHWFKTSAAANDADNLNALPIDYTLGANEMYKGEISGRLALDLLSKVADETETSDYVAVYTYTITLGTISNTKNFTFTLKTEDNANKYKVYVALPGTVLVSLKEGVKFELTYGKEFTQNLVKFDLDKFIVDGAKEDVDFDDIQWTASNHELEYTIANVGAYEITISDATLMLAGGAVPKIKIDGVESDYRLKIAPFSVYVVPAEIVIEPYAENNSKEYASSESAFDIKHKLVSVAGLPIYDDAGNIKVENYAGREVSALEAVANGSFARAIYANDGSFIAFGSKNDMVSDANGVVFGSTNYYSFAVYNEFTSKDEHGNFIVKVQLDNTNRLQITPAKLVVDKKDFVGINKVFDGTDTVKYTDLVKAININSLLKVSTDDVEVAFIAKYESNNDSPASSVGKKLIRFTSLSLSGEQACNYALYIIIDASEQLVTEETTFTIDKLINDGSTSDPIYILNGIISLVRSDFTIAKEYDSLTTLTKDAISIINREDASHKGTTVLYSLKDEMQVLYGQFADKEVSKNYQTDLELFFPLGQDATETNIEIDQTDKTIEVSLIEKDGVLGVRVYIAGIGAEIKQKTLGVNSFKSIVADDRDYNATPDVTFTYEFKEGAIVVGDEAYNNSSSIKLLGLVKDLDASEHRMVDVGTYDVEFTGYSIENTVFNKRYKVDIAALNSYYKGSNQLRVNIDYAKLLPRVDFGTRVYEGSTVVTFNENQIVDRSAGSSMLKTINFAEQLIEELKHFTYDNVATTYQYTNGNVQADEEGNVVLHDVKVSNMAVTAEIGFEYLLKNYVIYGIRENAGSYEEVGTVENGVTIDPYIMQNVAGLTKRSLQIVANDIDVVDKVYDGTKDATINVRLDESNAIVEDKEFLAVSATATYARKQVGESINVTVKVSKLVLKEGKEGHEDLLNNYELVPFTKKVQKDILKRPVEFAVSFDDRIYSGEELITKNLIKYDLGSMLASDAKSYTVATENGAYYLDKDVAFTLFTKLEDGAVFDANKVYYKDNTGSVIADDVNKENFSAKISEGLYISEYKEIDKLGTAYNPVLYNSKEKYINYELSTKYDSLLKGKDFYAYQKKDGQVYYGDFESTFTATTATSEFIEGAKYYDANKQLVNLEKSVFDSNKATTTWYYLEFDNIEYYFYKMPSTTKYIKVSEYEALTDGNKSEIDGYIVGFYIYDNNDVFVINEDYAGTIELSTMPKLQYVQGYGKVTRREISIASVATLIPDSFTKVFDGTTKYYGESGIDYNFSTGSIVNDIKTDELKVATVDASFKTSITGTTQVMFVATGLTTDPDTGAQNNYSSTTMSSSAVPAKITKRAIYAKLLDAEMVYGTSVGSVKPEIKYYLDAACTTEIIINDKGWFVDFESFIDTLEATNAKFDYATLEENFKAELDDLRYAEDFTKATNGMYYKLPGTFTEPTADISISSTKPVVGYVADKYGLKGGFASNFEFTPVYTANGKDSYSKLEVIKKVVYVIADATKTYTREYGKDLNQDAVKVLIVNENGKDGIISGETFKNVYGKDTTLSVVFKKIDITNTSTSYGIKDASLVTARSLINVTDGDNEGLGANEFYVAYIEVPAVASQNYDVRFGEIVYDDSTGTFKYSFEGTSFTATVPQLTIVLPQLEDVTLSAEEKVVTYQRDTNHAKYLVSNLGSKDTVTIGGIAANNVKVDVDGNVIAYEGEVVVTRELIANEKAIAYKIRHSLGNAKLTVEKASPGLVVKNKTVEFNGTAREVTKDSYYLTNSGVGYTDNDFSVEYYLNDKKVDMSKTQLIDVESYIYVVKFNSSDANYLSEEKRAMFIISPATISVQVTTEKLIQEYIVGKEYRIDYTISDINGIGIEKSDTEFKFLKDGKVVDITKAGRYQFVIGLKSQKAEEYKSNVVFINNIGNLDLTVHEIESYNKENDKVADLTLKNTSDSILADLYTTRYVYANNNLAEDDLYWASTSQYMPQIEKSIGTGATLAAIVRMNLSYGVNSQTLKGKEAIVTVSLPEIVPANMKGYAVYQTTSTGTLQVIKPSDYVINKDNTITYTTTYLGSLVFVKLGEEGLPAATIGGIAGGSAAVVLLVAGAVAITLIKKKKLKAKLN